MAEGNKTTVIDFSDNAKNAALFFDYVIPLSKSIAIRHYLGEISIPQLKPIFPISFQVSNKYADFWNVLYRVGNNLTYIEKNYKEIIEHCEKIIKGESCNNCDDCCLENDTIYLEQSYNYAQKGLEGLWEEGWGDERLPTGAYYFIYPSVEDKSYNISYECTSLSLAQIPLIDTSQTEWEQIIQIREDEESIKKLRNLRLFFHQNYSDKEKSFVEDDLCKRYEDYENTVKGWGFETITSSIQMLLTSPVTVASIGTSLAMALFGEPLSALATAGTGVGLEIGKMSLHIAREKKKLSVLQRDHPLAYIIDAKRKLEGK